MTESMMNEVVKMVGTTGHWRLEIVMGMTGFVIVVANVDYNR